KIGRNATHITASRDCLRREAEDCETENAITRFYVRDIGSDGGNDPAHFVAEDAGIGCFARIKRECLEHIAEIHSRGFDIDDYFFRTAGRLNERCKVQRIELTSLARSQTQWHRRIQCSRYARTSTI